MPVDAHGGAPPQSSSTSSHGVNTHQEVVHPVVSYKIGYFKHVCTAAVFKQVNSLRRKLETGADWDSLEAVHELHKLLLECTTTVRHKDGSTDPSSSCSQADTETPQSSPRSSDVEGSRHYPLSDVAVQVDACFDDLDEYNINELPIVDVDEVVEHRNLKGEEQASQRDLTEDQPSRPLKNPTHSKLAAQPVDSRVLDRSVGICFSPSRSFWMVTEESREKIRELEATVEALSKDHTAALQQVEIMQNTLAQVAKRLGGGGASKRQSEQTESSGEQRQVEPTASFNASPSKQMGRTGVTHGRNTPRSASAAASTPREKAARDQGGCSAWLSSPNPEAGKVVVVPAGTASNDFDLDETQSMYVEAPKRLFAF